MAFEVITEDSFCFRMIPARKQHTSQRLSHGQVPTWRLVICETVFNLRRLPEQVDRLRLVALRQRDLRIQYIPAIFNTVLACSGPTAPPLERSSRQS